MKEPAYDELVSALMWLTSLAMELTMHYDDKNPPPIVAAIKHGNRLLNRTSMFRRELLKQPDHTLQALLDAGAIDAAWAKKSRGLTPTKRKPT